MAGSDKSDFKCSEHGKELEVICEYCNRLMCSRCSISHIKETDHSKYCHHIDDIKSSFGNGGSGGAGFINDKMNRLWTNVKSASLQYQRLSASDEELSKHFDQLHKFLTNKEQKLKKPILNDQEFIINNIDSYIKEMKQLLYIKNMFNEISTNPANSADSNTGADNNPDTTEKYMIQYVISQVDGNTTMDSFINSNSETLFNSHMVGVDTDLVNVKSRLVSYYNNNMDSLLLDTIYKFNKQFKVVGIENNDYVTYKLNVDKGKMNIINLLIKDSYKLKRIIKENDTKITKSTFIFALYLPKGASLIDITDKDSHIQPSTVENIVMDINSSFTYSSVVAVYDHIYIFGEFDNPNKYYMLSARTKTIDYVGEIKDIDHAYGVATCFDGKEYIYIINGYNNDKKIFTSRIDRFNIESNTFEKYFEMSSDYNGYIVLAFCYNDLIYFVPCNKNLILIFNPINKTIEQYSSKQLFNTNLAACTDGNGNIYIYSFDNKLTQFNVETKQFKNLVLPNTGSFGYMAMTYRKVSNHESYIYLLGGKQYKNHRYSIEENEWIEIFETDERFRSGTGAILIEI